MPSLLLLISGVTFVVRRGTKRLSKRKLKSCCQFAMIVLNTRMQIFFVLFFVSWLFVVASNFFRSLFGPTSGPTPLELTPLSSPLAHPPPPPKKKKGKAFSGNHFFLSSVKSFTKRSRRDGISPDEVGH